ncbi:hypothetical protein [Hymenobacter psychrophilus]|uniref:Uncharacterized protein n=1 Tax=Hymenobacter psychrophilus TaxID=651662 RepID=A0A1H3EXV9_9BACT|nr:hypothetical protein [Hymenobacter psychrophilus]SDX82754.1 hypothetical protein SAMN04488069_103324 [Hymenobacter psychrophilus]
MANHRKCTCSDDDFRQAVAESLSVRQVLGRIGLVPAGGNYKTVHTRIARLGLDISPRRVGIKGSGLECLVSPFPGTAFWLRIQHMFLHSAYVSV